MGYVVLRFSPEELRARPKSRVSLTLWAMIALVVVVALIGLFT